MEGGAAGKVTRLDVIMASTKEATWWKEATRWKEATWWVIWC
jgi:hypothetical protein